MHACTAVSGGRRCTHLLLRPHRCGAIAHGQVHGKRLSERGHRRLLMLRQQLRRNLPPAARLDVVTLAHARHELLLERARRLCVTRSRKGRLRLAARARAAADLGRSARHSHEGDARVGYVPDRGVDQAGKLLSKQPAEARKGGLGLSQGKRSMRGLEQGVWVNVHRLGGRYARGARRWPGGAEGRGLRRWG